MACPYANPLLQRLAFEQFHGDERLAFVFVNVVNGADVGVIQRRGSARFALEALEGLAVDARALTRSAAGGPPSPRGRGLQIRKPLPSPWGRGAGGEGSRQKLQGDQPPELCILGVSAL